MTVATLTLLRHPGGVSRLEAGWPRRLSFTLELLLEGGDLIDWHGDLVTIRVDAGRAIYRIVERAERVLVGELVYSEG